jgi:hypothetical protein
MWNEIRWDKHIIVLRGYFETAVVLFTKYLEEEIMKDKMGEACSCVGMMSRTYKSSVRS